MTATLTFTDTLRAKVRAVLAAAPWADEERYPGEVSDLTDELVLVVTRTIAEYSVQQKVGA